ncbi:MAG TPA: helix-turn-helix domain-containing protein, partial [Polyangiaceae bacterium]|nr:helix-turn-helix domain-containing protein [Polyangiaceae bacterium]
MATDVAGRWLTTKEAAALLRVHPKHMYRLLKQGLPASRVGGQWRFQAAELASWSRGGRGRAGNEEKQIATQGLPGFLAADDDLAVDLLLSLLHRDRAPLLGRVSRNRRVPLEPLLDGSVLAVAVLGDLPEPPSIPLARIHLAHVQLGLAACPGGPAPSLALLSTKRQRLASWTSGSDPRSILEGVLEREGIDPVRVHSRALEVLSHADTIAAVVARRADLAWTSAAWADRFSLPFLPLASRSLALVARADSLGNPCLIRCWQVLQSEAFREAIRSLPGYDAEGSGEIRYLSGAGDSFQSAPKPPQRAAPRTQPAASPSRPPIRCAIVTRGHGQDASSRILRLVRALVAR